MIITIGPSFHLAHTLQITWNNGCLHTLSKAGVHSMSIIIDMWCILMLYFRCTVLSSDIDSGRFIQCLKAHTELLCETFEMKELWYTYGIVGYLEVNISY